jgi:protein-L-isoaspartate(D-aspartate) O-methyltransferase
MRVCLTDYVSEAYRDTWSSEVVGPTGRVTAVEIDPWLASRARTSLAHYPNVEVIEGDRGTIDTGIRDAILVNAGVTHPTKKWLDSIAVGGTDLLRNTFTLRPVSERVGIRELWPVL